MRVTPLEVGKTYEFDRYFRKQLNPVVLKVHKREEMELPDGTKVMCLVVQPIVGEKGSLFGKQSDTRVWLTDDERRIPGADPHSLRVRHHHDATEGDAAAAAARAGGARLPT